MNNIKINRLLLLITILLLSGNLVMLSFIWLKKPILNEQPIKENINRPSRNNFEHRIANELQLSPKQIDTYHVLKEAYMIKIRNLLDSIKQNKWLIHQELMKESPNINFINQISDSIGQLNAEFEKINYYHLFKLREGLNEEQLEKYENLLKQLPYGNRYHDNVRRYRNRR